MPFAVIEAALRHWRGHTPRLHFAVKRHKKHKHTDRRTHKRKNRTPYAPLCTHTSRTTQTAPRPNLYITGSTVYTTLLPNTYANTNTARSSGDKNHVVTNIARQPKATHHHESSQNQTKSWPRHPNAVKKRKIICLVLSCPVLSSLDGKLQRREEGVHRGLRQRPGDPRRRQRRLRERPQGLDDLQVGLAAQGVRHPHQLLHDKLLVHTYVFEPTSIKEHAYVQLSTHGRTDLWHGGCIRVRISRYIFRSTYVVNEHIGACIV